MLGTDLRVRHGYVESCISQEASMRSWELIGAQEPHLVLLETAFLSQERPHGSQESLISTYPHKCGFYTPEFETESTLIVFEQRD
jgi:xanthine dehydrogenase iron-sulfur cluster and FAD-binding subunit A